MSPHAPRRVPRGAPWLDRWRRDVADPERKRLAQLATVSPGGAPEVRTVVLRDLSDDGAPMFAADRRSAKIRAVRAGSHAELCVWWSGPDVQVRLRGPLFVVDADTAGPWADVRGQMWSQMRPTEQRGFAGPAPGTPIDVPPAPPDVPTDPHPNFVLGVLTPLRFDRLVLGDPHEREVYAWSPDGWTGGRVQP